MNLKIKFCKHIPFKGNYALTLFDYMIIRKEYEYMPILKTTLNHESIHQAQSRDFGIGFCGYFIFYLLYLLEWLLKLPFTFFGYDAYHSISFEQESYNNEYNLSYLTERKRFAWVKYMFKLVKK